MPNWCSNYATFTHKDPDQVQKLVAAVDDDCLFNTFVPLPEELKETDGLKGDDPELIKKYGAADWYNWNVNNWGAKWDASDAMINNKTADQVSVSFETAWSPPTAFYEHMLDQGWEIMAYYYEPGMSYCGAWDNGQDDSYEIPATAEETREYIPEEIDDMFAISESQEAYEDENREELTAWIQDGVEARKEGA